MISRMSRYSRIFSNNSTGRLERLAEGIRVAEDKKACDRDRRKYNSGIQNIGTC